MKKEAILNIKNENKEKNPEKRMYIYIGIMLFLLFVNNTMSMAVPSIVFLLVSLIPALSEDESDIVALAACCIPMSMGFQHKYALMMGIAALLLRGKINFKRPQIVIAVLFMMLWELLHGLNGTFSLNEYLRNFAELIFLAAISCSDLKKVNYKLVYRSLAISTVGVCMIILYVQLVKNNISITELFSQNYNLFRFGRGNTEIQGFRLSFNPNALGMVCNLATVGILILYGRHEHSVLDLLLMCMCILFGMTTLARSYFICLAFILLYFLLSLPGNVGEKVSRIIGISAIGAIIWMLVFIFFPAILENMAERFSESDILNGRDTLFVFFNSHIVSSFKHFFYGIGLQGFRGKMFSLYGVEYVPHNGPQEIFVVWGIVGVFAFLLLLWGMIRVPKKIGRKYRAYQFIPLCLIILYTMSSQLITSYIALTSLSIAYMTFHIDSKEES